MIGDVTGDGLKDVILQSYSVPLADLVILQRTSAGGFNVHGPFPWPGSVEMVVGDVNNDSIEDIVGMDLNGSGTSSTIQIDVAYGNAAAVFSVGSTYVTNLYGGLIGIFYARSTLGDYDLDGLREIGTGSRLIRVMPTYGGNPSSVINPPWFDSSQWPPGIGLLCPQDTFDADGDGDLDVLILGISGFTTTSLYAGIAINRTIVRPDCSGGAGPLSMTAGTPAPGNPSFQLGLSGAAPSTVVALGLSHAEGFNPVGPCIVALDLAPNQLIFPVGNLGIMQTNGAGVAQVTLSVPNVPTLLGTDYFLQWIAVDPTGPINLLGINYSLSGARRIMLW